MLKTFKFLFLMNICVGASISTWAADVQNSKVPDCPKDVTEGFSIFVEKIQPNVKEVQTRARALAQAYLSGTATKSMRESLDQELDKLVAVVKPFCNRYIQIIPRDYECKAFDSKTKRTVLIEKEAMNNILSSCSQILRRGRFTSLEVSPVG